MSLVELLRKVLVVGTKAKVGCDLDAFAGVLRVPEGDEELDSIDAAFPVPDSGAGRDVELVTVVLATEVVGSRLYRTSKR
jgi:hypothetical protein